MINCPSCGAALPVRGPGVPYTVCRYCQSLILRGEQSVEDVGKVALVPDDISPVSIGTRFHLGGQDFITAGRVRWGWSGGSWNEWLLFSADGQSRWLGEAMGMYMLTTERPDAAGLPLAQAIARREPVVPGQSLELDGIAFEVADVKQAECLGGEGDLPFRALPGWTMTNVDFRSPTRDALSIQHDADGTHAWLGMWHELADLNPRGLRELEGWPMPDALR